MNVITKCNPKNVGPYVRLRLINNSENHPSVYIKLQIITKTKSIKKRKYSPLPISTSRTFIFIILKLTITAINSFFSLYAEYSFYNFHLK